MSIDSAVFLFADIALAWCVTLLDVIVQTGTFLSDVSSAVCRLQVRTLVHLMDQLDRIFDCPGAGIRSVIF